LAVQYIADRGDGEDQDVDSSLLVGFTLVGGTMREFAVPALAGSPELNGSVSRHDGERLRGNETAHPVIGWALGDHFGYFSSTDQ
jgi:hypothetical protein